MLLNKLSAQLAGSRGSRTHTLFHCAGMNCRQTGDAVTGHSEMTLATGEFGLGCSFIPYGNELCDLEHSM